MSDEHPEEPPQVQIGAPHASEPVEPAEPAEPAEPTEPFHTAEILHACRRPDRVVDLVLAQWPRLAESVTRRECLAALAALMLLVSILASLPYGAVLEIDGFWKIGALFVGSMAICFPSLFIFSSYLGCRFDIGQNLALALVITCVAGLFCFGFFPILWFLDATMAGGGASVTTRHISFAFLAAALVAGIGHLVRCMRGGLLRSAGGAYSMLMLLWQALLIFITYRMGVTLELY